LLPIQLIPYFQYTASALLETLLLGLNCWQAGQRGFHGASVEVDQNSRVTAWLVACWVTVFLRGLRRAHATLRGWYDLNRIRTPKRPKPWEEIRDYFLSLGGKKDLCLGSLFRGILNRYSRTTKHFLFGTPSQERMRR